MGGGGKQRTAATEANTVVGPPLAGCQRTSANNTPSRPAATVESDKAVTMIYRLYAYIGIRWILQLYNVPTAVNCCIPLKCVPQRIIIYIIHKKCVLFHMFYIHPYGCRMQRRRDAPAADIVCAL